MHLPESHGGGATPTRTVILLIHPQRELSQFISTSLAANFALSEIAISSHVSESDLSSIEVELRRLRGGGYEIFALGVGECALLALNIAQLYGDEIAGVIVHSFHWRGPRKYLQKIRKDLYLIDQPLMTINSDDFSDDVSASSIREITTVKDDLDAVVAGETNRFINEVRAGIWEDDERNLINAEFNSIVSGLNLDQSTTSNYLDSLDRAIDSERFQQPDPPLIGTQDPVKRNALIAMVAGPIYAIVVSVIGFNPFGIEPWPGVLIGIGGVATFLYRWQGNRDDDDGAIL